MATAENPAKPRLRYPIDLDEIERMTPEERAELDLPDHNQLPCDDESIVKYSTERAAHEAARADLEAKRAARETARADRLAAQLRALGIEPDA